MGRSLSTLCVMGVLVAAQPAAAQPEGVLVTYGGEAAPRALSTWKEHVERAATAAGYTVIEDPVEHAIARSGSGAVLPARVSAFIEVETLLVEARQAAAALREGRALALLARAERLAEDHADVPGSAAWIAEVQTAIGITAAQAGISELMEHALAKAATLDATRGVRAAEAPPAVVTRASAIARAVATRPTGSFEVRASVPGARVFLDDEEVGVAPRLVRAPVGRHVLRVEAPGHLPWGRAVNVLEGARPAVEVALAPDPLVTLAREIGAAGRALDAAIAAGAVGAVPGVDAVWMIEIGPGPRNRALFVACTGAGCTEPRRLEIDEVPIVIPRARVELSRIAALVASARRWLREPEPTRRPPPALAWWERWYVWAGAAVLLGGAVAGVVVLAQPDRGEARRVIVDPPDF